MKPRALLSGLALLATLVALGYAFESGVFGTVLDERWIDRAVRGHGIARPQEIGRQRRDSGRGEQRER